MKIARKIVDILVEMRHEVLTRHLVEDSAWEADRRITPQEVYLRDMKWLEQCDLFMAEVSGSPFGLGFETGYLLGGTTKRVVLFYRRDVETKISLLITGLPTRIADWRRIRTSTRWRFGSGTTCLDECSTIGQLGR